MVVDTRTAMVLAQLRLGAKTDGEVKQGCKDYGMRIGIAEVRELLAALILEAAVISTGERTAFGSIGRLKTKSKRKPGPSVFALTYIGQMQLDSWHKGARVAQ